MSDTYIKYNTVVYKVQQLMSIKIHLPMEDSLTDNHHLRATTIIHQSTTRCQQILYPTKCIRPELPNESTSNCEKESLKNYEPYLPMVATWFMGPVNYLNSPPYRC